MAPIFIAAFISLLMTGFFCYTITRTLAHVSPENQDIKPKFIWLLLIPGFNWIWNFFVASKLSSSLKKELVARDFEVTQRPTLTQGMLYAAISLISVVPSMMIRMSATTAEEILSATKNIPENVAMAIEIIGILQIILFLTYWSKISWYKNVLEKDEQTNYED